MPEVSNEVVQALRAAIERQNEIIAQLQADIDDVVKLQKRLYEMLDAMQRVLLMDKLDELKEAVKS